MKLGWLLIFLLFIQHSVHSSTMTRIRLSITPRRFEFVVPDLIFERFEELEGKFLTYSPLHSLRIYNQGSI